MKEKEFDVIVVGGGHAGIEAALASSRMGARTALLVMDLQAVGRMSCNPAIGGTAKGHLVREVDALGGEMGKLADHTGIHFRMLNTSKGPAVWSPRCQNDREWYSREAVQRVVETPGLEVVQDSLEDLALIGGRVSGAITASGRTIPTRCIVICTGTFLNAVMHTGLEVTPGGRFGEPASTILSGRLRAAGLRTARLKTGTPPRLRRSSIDFQSTLTQNPDADPTPFSFSNREIRNRQIPMYLTFTSARTHEILKTGFDESPMFTGRITGTGPRYCPSIEDKIFRFAEKERHQIFLEPEGYDSEVVYVNGFSTSLPARVQLEAIRTVPGLEHSELLRPGYAVEYDFFPPFQLEHSLESKMVKGLFFAGQVNGTSGYEEAAGQGLMAGINAVLRAREQDPVILSRAEAYIGVMIDDLINKGTEEPYRMFTSRAEYRLLLRQDNADTRLMRKGHELGLVDGSLVRTLEDKERRIADAKRALDESYADPAEINSYLENMGSGPIAERESLLHMLKRPEVTLEGLLAHVSAAAEAVRPILGGDRSISDRVQIETKYDGYLRRQEEEVEKHRRFETMPIPEGVDFRSMRALSSEAREKLDRIKPRTIGQAARISGITPADVSVLMVHVR